MRLFLLGVATVTLLTAPAMAQNSADAAAKMELAQEYSRLIPVDKDIEKTIEQLALQVPVAQRTQFKSILERTINADRLETASELALVEIFTREELAALIEFYKTPEGQAIKDKMPVYQGRIQPVLEEMIREAAQSLQAQMNGQ